MSLTYGSMCSGYAGLELGIQSVLGGETLWHVEFDKAPSAILDHHYPGVPNYGDLTTTDWHSVPRVHILTAGYPCQPFSHAGKRKGTDDERHLWPHIANAVAILRPPLLAFENVRGHLSLGFNEVVRDLHQLNYDVHWYMLRAADVGAAHGRARIFIFGRNRGKCGVCGRTDRRRGLDRDNQSGPWGDLRDQPQGLDVGHGTAGSPSPRGSLRREGDPRPGRNGHSSTDLALAADGQEGRSRAADGRPSPLGEARAVPRGAGAHGDGRGRTDGPRRGYAVDSRDVSAGRAAAPADQAPQSSWAGPGPAEADATGGLPMGCMVGAGGRPLRAGGVSGEVPGVRANDGRPCLCDDSVGAAHGRFRVFLFAQPADSDDSGLEVLADQAGAAPTGRHGHPESSTRGSAVEHIPGQLTLLKTPTSQLAINGGSQHPDKRKDGGHGPTLADEVEHLLPTPGVAGGGKKVPEDAHWSGNAAYKPDGTKVQVHLDYIAEQRLLPTPVTTDAKGARNATSGRVEGSEHHGGTTLTDAISQDWREYEAAIRRQENAFGRPAPLPTEPGNKGQPRLSPRFVEWLMALPDGWVTDVPGISRNDQLKALGNGVVPPQAAAATRAFLEDTMTEARTA